MKTQITDKKEFLDAIRNIGKEGKLKKFLEWTEANDRGEIYNYFFSRNLLIGVVFTITEQTQPLTINSDWTVKADVISASCAGKLWDACKKNFHRRVDGNPEIQEWLPYKSYIPTHLRTGGRPTRPSFG